MNRDIKKYNEFINEMKLVDMDKKTKSTMLSNLKFKLDEYKKYILDNIKISDGDIIYNDFDNIETKIILRELTNQFGSDLIDEIKINTLLDEINDLMDNRALDIKKNISAKFFNFKKKLYSI